MLKIGELSKICNVSIQTLRYYDKMGLLAADLVDESSGYRYYSPEKIAVYQQIAHLKELGFSLSEIKSFLESKRDKRLVLYARKKRKIQEKIVLLQDTVKQIDKACTDVSNGVLPYYSIPRVPFKDDKSVIGRWKYIGDLPQGKGFESVEELEKKEILLNDLFFIPGGNQFWIYFWTKGILYSIVHERNIIVPNEYRLFRRDGKDYMAIDWMVDKCIYDNAPDCTRIYERIDAEAYTVKQTFLYADDTTLDFVPDEAALGRWEVFDLIEDINDFSVSKKHTNEASLYIKALEFYPNGSCCRYYSGDASGMSRVLNYTAGIIMTPEMCVAERYFIKREKGSDYLIVEHKSGDYLYTGKIFCYYVFRRVEE